MLKITYEVSNELIRTFVGYAQNPKTQDVFVIAIQNLAKEAFEAGRDFQKRYKEEEEE